MASALPSSAPLVCLALFGFLRLFGHLTDPALDRQVIHRIVGEPHRLTQVEAAPARVTLLTWNIERGQRFEAVRDALADLDADICLLQEVDRFCRRSGGRDVARDLAEALGYNWLYAGEFQEVGERAGKEAALTGQAVLSRYPLDAASVLSFRTQARFRWRFSPIQPRHGGRIALRVRAAGLILYDVHLESGGNEKRRRRQLDELLADGALHESPGDPIILAGDFNNRAVARSLLFDPIRAARFVDVMAGAQAQPTTRRSRHPIDWIFARGVTPLEARVLSGRHGSDHFPLVATVVVGS